MADITGGALRATGTAAGAVAGAAESTISAGVRLTNTVIRWLMSNLVLATLGVIATALTVAFGDSSEGWVIANIVFLVLFAIALAFMLYYLWVNRATMGSIGRSLRRLGDIGQYEASRNIAI